MAVDILQLQELDCLQPEISGRRRYPIRVLLVLLYGWAGIFDGIPRSRLVRTAVRIGVRHAGMLRFQARLTGGGHIFETLPGNRLAHALGCRFFSWRDGLGGLIHAAVGTVAGIFRRT